MIRLKKVKVTREQLIKGYQDTIRAYQNEIKLINNALASGYYLNETLKQLRNRKGKLQRRINNNRNLTLKIIKGM